MESLFFTYIKGFEAIPVGVSSSNGRVRSQLIARQEDRQLDARDILHLAKQIIELLLRMQGDNRLVMADKDSEKVI